MKKKNKIIWCERGWQPVYIGFCPSEKAWKKFQKKSKSVEPYPETDARCTFFENLDGKNTVLVTINWETAKKYKSVEVFALLCHEAVHVFQFICNSIGEDSPSPEFEAYSIQVITLNLISAYEEVIGE